ncbi:hypothetical protein [Hymenobacter chitinivorans]|uniref:Uncharacterized protein n=1 Tax=Hymenobacter chitinivorans DSM 11115 TaxID=1121954 RepID=A0A2M9B976_9BACT|nr:hypothetical protein [Hymenobacter chitinivorans]PJJ54467.1 hypothetical protein CLV45_2805 [Hymenobacter chitinivorans DSM 11115]
MNDKQRARLTMMQATLAVLNQYAAVYTANKALGTARAELAALVQHLDPTADTQQAAHNPNSAGAVKKTTRNHLAQRAAEVAAALLAYADAQDDIRLHTAADYSEYQLRRATDNDLPRIAKNIHDQAKDHFAALQEQGVTQQELTELAAALAAYQAEQTAPRLATADAKANTKVLAADLRKATGLLRNRIDKFLIRYQRSEPKFHTAYQSARKVINTAARPATEAKVKPSV